MPTAPATYPHLSLDRDGAAVIDHVPRFRVADVALAYLSYGYSVDEMARQFPVLTEAELHAAMTYYFDHRDEVEALIRAESKSLDDAARASSPLAMRLKSSMNVRTKTRRP